MPPKKNAVSRTRNRDRLAVQSREKVLKWAADSVWTRAPWAGAVLDVDEDVPGAPRRPAVTVLGSAHRSAGAVVIASAEKELLVGRPGEGEGDYLAIEHDGLISRRHARIVPRAEAFEIHDLNSLNGTFDGACPIPDRTVVPNGTLLFLGASAVMLRFMSDRARAAVVQDWQAPFMATPTLCPQVALLHQRLRARLDDAQPVFFSGPPGCDEWAYAAALHEKGAQGGSMQVVDAGFLRVSEGGNLVVDPVDVGNSVGAGSVSRRLADIAIEADRGTLFLWGVDNAPPVVQLALAKVVRAGFGRTRPVLSALAQSGQPGESNRALVPELENACGSTPFRLPALARRREDIPGILQHTLGHSAGVTFSVAAWRALLLYDWPGNLEQLISTGQRLRVERTAGAPKQIKIGDLPNAMRLTCGAWLRDEGKAPPDTADSHQTISDEEEMAALRVRAAGSAKRAVTIETAAVEIGAVHHWTPAQIQLIAQLALGWSKQDVRHRLGIAASTVREQLRRAALSTRVSDTGELVRMVIRWSEGRKRGEEGE